MRRRSHLFVAFVALVTVGWNVVTTQPGGSALAADPQAELQQTRAQLADAKTAQQALSATLQRQRSELADLEHRSNQLGDALDLARAELAAVTAEYDRVSSLLVQVKEQVTEIEQHLVDLNDQIDELTAKLLHVAAAINRRTAQLTEREDLLRGTPSRCLRAEPDVAPRDHPLRRLARRGHRPVRLPDHRLGPGCGPRRRDPIDPRGARHPARVAPRGRAACSPTRARSRATRSGS